jgi:hypothetical protein
MTVLELHARLRYDARGKRPFRRGQAIMVRTALLLVVLTLSLDAWAQGDFALTYRPAKEGEESPFLGVSVGLSPSHTTPVEIPKRFSAKTAYTFTRAGRGSPITVVFFDSPGSGLYADLDADGQLFDDHPARARLVAPNRRFYDDDRIYGPVNLTIPGSNGRLTARFEVYAGTTKDKAAASVRPVGYCTGSVNLAGAAYQIALCDADFDGKYNTPCERFDGRYAGLDCDCFAIDLDHDGAFHRVREIWPLTQLVRVGGGWYHLTILDDGSKIRVKTVEPQFQLGRLDTGCKEAEMLVYSPKVGLVHLAGSDGTWAVPNGTYTVMRAWLAATDARRVRWELEERTAAPLNLKPTFTITEGETHTIKRGLPLRVVPHVSFGRMAADDRPVVYVNYDIVGQGEERYWYCAFKRENEMTLASLRILNEQGKVVNSGRFSSSQYRWYLPRSGFKGRFCIEVTPVLGPFPFTCEQQWHTVESLPPVE